MYGGGCPHRCLLGAPSTVVKDVRVIPDLGEGRESNNGINPISRLVVLRGLLLCVVVELQLHL